MGFDVDLESTRAVEDGDALNTSQGILSTSREALGEIEARFIDPLRPRKIWRKVRPTNFDTAMCGALYGWTLQLSSTGSNSLSHQHLIDILTDRLEQGARCNKISTTGSFKRGLDVRLHMGTFRICGRNIHPQCKRASENLPWAFVCLITPIRPSADD